MSPLEIAVDPFDLPLPVEAPPAPRPPSRLALRQPGQPTTVVDVGSARLGGETFVLLAGPCAVEDPEQLDRAAAAVAQAGGAVLRGGAFKPRTSPYSFRGLGREGLELLADAGRRHGLPVVTEAMSVDQVGAVSATADMLQIGARNMQNFALLEAAGRAGKPVLLKRGAAATIDEWLWAAEYVLAAGNPRVVLCERGVRTFEPATRNTLDLSAVAVLRERTHLPVLVDPSHAAGDRRYVPALARAARAVGAHGLLVEIHPDPEHARCDGDQSLTLGQWRAMAGELAGAPVEGGA